MSQIHMDDWRCPLTNISQCGGRGHRARPTAIVHDAEGNVLLVFAGVPYRTNEEAIAMATEFCERMNARGGVRNCDIGTDREQAERFSRFCMTRKCSTCEFSKMSHVQCVALWLNKPYGWGGVP